MAENERKYVVTTTLNDEEREMLDILLDEFKTDEDQFLRIMIQLFYKMGSQEK